MSFCCIILEMKTSFFLKRWESICATVLDAMLEIYFVTEIFKTRWTLKFIRNCSKSPDNTDYKKNNEDAAIEVNNTLIYEWNLSFYQI